MTETVVATGLLTISDVQRLAQRIRSGTVGPTAVYYAGVSAPVITASMALITRQALGAAGLSNYWQLFLAALLAAFAGIAWYLIFIRWSYRHKFGRGTEVSVATEVTASTAGLTVVRGDIATQIGWSAVRSVDVQRNDIVITIVGADALIIPKHWFGEDCKARGAFVTALSMRDKAVA